MSKPQSLSSYAQTTVPSHRSKEGIEALLIRIGAVGFRWSSNPVQGYEILEAGLEWKGKERAFRLRVEFEDERERKQKMRALYWYLKTKIEAIQFGLVDLEQEFLPYLLTSGGQTVYEHLGESNIALLEAPEEAQG